MQNKPLTEMDEWGALARHQEDIQRVSLQSLFADDRGRFKRFHTCIEGLAFDYSKNHINDETMTLLCALARGCGVEEMRGKMFTGEAINGSDGRAVLHSALRGSCDAGITVNGENVCDFAQRTLRQVEDISAAIRGDSGITDVVSIGIGGSDLGPRMVCDALKDFSSDDADSPAVHFISNIDGHKISRLLRRLRPENTVFIIASKTFTTLETMANARVARDWIVAALGEDAVGDHFYAISTNEAAARDFGILPAHIMPMRDWVGGRYSVWGAIGLPIAVAIGFEKFQAFLDGAKAADLHFLNAELEGNIPVIMAMLGVWYRNFIGYETHAILPYAQNLSQFPAFIQQLDMESNGKSVDVDGRRVSYPTGGVVFGGAGTNAQHAFFQLLHQGTQIVPSDFIAVIHPQHDLKDHHTQLLANALAQSQAFMQGDVNEAEPHRNFEGGRPSSMLLLDRLDPYHLGLLMALYEHKIFVQGVIWNINSFDQWGVELGKALAHDTTRALKGERAGQAFDFSTDGLIAYIREKSGR